ncbi:unnamed protein product [Lactuca saligna]|uniref:Uncharacterized protein n=1 Tax=Lactuca saligna TaxID=75948 RepID=A0AA36EJU2_LACSI|nr:unnamed protein product [Lactuca saligna]
MDSLRFLLLAWRIWDKLKDHDVVPLPRRGVEIFGQLGIDPWAKKRFQMWSITKEPPTTTPIVQYVKGNDYKKTIGVVHGGNFTCVKTSVDYITLVNIEFPDMEMLGRFSKSLAYETFEHNTKHVPMNSPHYLMNAPSTRIEKLIHLLVIEDPRATVDDGIAYIKQMMNMTIPREKIEDLMDIAKENVIAWQTL